MNEKPPITMIQPYCPECGLAALWKAIDRYQPLLEQVWQAQCECGWTWQGRRYATYQLVEEGA